jgi:hypothetical protein
MSQDHTEREYHLTPVGWVSGTFRVYGAATEEMKPPPDRVETWIEEIDDTSGGSSPAVFWRQIWESDSVSPETRAELNRKFPRPKQVTGKKPKKKLRKSWNAEAGQEESA